MEGTPLTHSHFLNVHQGSYGPALSAAEGLFPGVTTPLANFWLQHLPRDRHHGAMAAHAVLGRDGSLLRELEL